MLTDLEKKFFEAFLKCDFNDGQGLYATPWVYSVSDEFQSRFNLSGLQFAGVCSSLTQKGLLSTHDHEESGNTDDMYFAIPKDAIAKLMSEGF